MTWKMRCVDCKKDIYHLWKPRMIWMDSPSNDEYECPATRSDHNPIWISDGKTPIRDFLTAWNYPPPRVYNSD